MSLQYTSSFQTPILIITFNRPDFTKRLLDIVAAIRPASLFVASDGPRAGNPSDIKNVNECRELFTNLSSWPCELKQLAHEENLGCKYAVSSAINWFFSHVDYGIILEDDCIPSISFFKFCEEILIKYKNDNRIGLVTGQCPRGFQFKGPESYSFSKYATIWGWATWKRVWCLYDVEMSDWSSLKSKVLSRITSAKSKFYWKKQFRLVFEGKLNTWDYQLVYLLLKINAKTVVPRINLITNVGFDERATHTRCFDPNISNQEAFNMQFPLIDNLNLSDSSVDVYYEKFVFRRSTLTRKILKGLKKYFDLP